MLHGVSLLQGGHTLPVTVLSDLNSAGVQHHRKAAPEGWECRKRIRGDQPRCAPGGQVLNLN